MTRRILRKSPQKWSLVSCLQTKRELFWVIARGIMRKMHDDDESAAPWRRSTLFSQPHLRGAAHTITLEGHSEATE